MKKEMPVFPAEMPEKMKERIDTEKFSVDDCRHVEHALKTRGVTAAWDVVWCISKGKRVANLP